MKTITKQHTIRGYAVGVTVTKRDDGLYTATAEITSNGSEKEVIDWQKRWEECVGVNAVIAGFSQNPYKNVLDFVDGYLEGRSKNAIQEQLRGVLGKKIPFGTTDQPFKVDHDRGQHDVILRIIRTAADDYKILAKVKYPTHTQKYDWEEFFDSAYKPGGEATMDSVVGAFLEWINSYCITHYYACVDAKERVDAGTGSDNDRLLAQKLKQQTKGNNDMKPRTNPTPKQLEQMQAAVDKLIEKLTMSGAAAVFETSLQTVNNWRARGRVSATAARDYEHTPEVKALGLSKETMRPDVVEWQVK